MEHAFCRDHRHMVERCATMVERCQHSTDLGRRLEEAQNIDHMVILEAALPVWLEHSQALEKST